MKTEFKLPKSKNQLQKELEDIFDSNMFNGNTISLGDSINNLIEVTGDTSYNEFNYLLQSILPIHYDAIDNINNLLDTPSEVEDSAETILANFPLFFEQSNKIYIPVKVERVIERYVSKTKLKEINPDIDVAKELCLILLSNLSNAFYTRKGGWKTLQAKELREQVGGKFKNTYKLIIDLLIKGTENGPIIERSKNFVIDQESYRYKLGESYLDKGVVTYELKTEYAKNLRRKSYFKVLNLSMDNIIAKNLIKTYSKIDIPTVEEIRTEGKRLVKLGHMTNKGKKLTFLNKHPKSYWKDADNRSFVEENIELFLRLTSNGFLIPMIGGSNSGGRVTDSFTLMPSWIRKMCKMDGDKIEEADYSALHPNIAMNIYKGNSEFITHDKVAERADIDNKTVKIEHLSFFNKTWKQMSKSPLFDFYSKEEPIMMENIYRDKDMFGHKITSKKMFKVEVNIMTYVIEKLNSEGIYVGYVYDALFCTPKNKQRVTDVMNEIILNFGVKTIAK